METTFKNYQISSEYIGDKLWPADDRNQNYNNHLITVKNTVNKKRTTFEFWGSVMAPEIQTKEDLLSAFSCFLADAVCADQSFENFCSELGYDTDSRKAEKVYKECYKSFKKAANLVSGNLYDLTNELSELV